MLSLRKQKKASSSANPVKELRKLSRQDLLELLLEQMREGDHLREELQSTQSQNASLTDLTDRLKAKLDDKDELIGRLKAKLNEKDELLEQVLNYAHDVVARRGRSKDVETFEELEYMLSQHFLAHDNQPEIPVDEPEKQLEQAIEELAEAIEEAVEEVEEPVEAAKEEPAADEPQEAEETVLIEGLPDLEEPTFTIKPVSTLGFDDDGVYVVDSPAGGARS